MQLANEKFAYAIETLQRMKNDYISSLSQRYMKVSWWSNIEGERREMQERRPRWYARQYEGYPAVDKRVQEDKEIRNDERKLIPVHHFLPQ